MSEWSDAVSLAFILGVVVGVVVDRTIIPWGERLGDRLARMRLRRRHGVR